MSNGGSVIRNKLQVPSSRHHVVRRSLPTSLLDRGGQSFRAPRSRFASSLRSRRDNALCRTFFHACLLPSSKLRKSRSSPSLSRGMSRFRLALVFLGLAAWLLTCGISVAVSFSTVVIDPGHGGFDRGGTRSTSFPKRASRWTSHAVSEAYLADAGFRVVMTRSSDTFVTLDRRVGTANAQRRAIFISIHFNSAPRRELAESRRSMHPPERKGWRA